MGNVVTMVLLPELGDYLSIDPVLVSLLMNISDTNSQPLANGMIQDGVI